VRFAQGIQRALEGERGGVIPQPLAAELVTPQLPGWGLGVGLYATTADRYFGHTGGNAGYRCELVASVHHGPAAAVMTNSDEGGALVPPLLNRLARGLGWSALARHGLAGITEIDFGGIYETAAGSPVRLEATATGALLTVHGQDPLPLEIRDAQTLATGDGAVTLTLDNDLAGRAVGFMLRQRDRAIVAIRRGR
jgi:hypothetical protein